GSGGSHPCEDREVVLVHPELRRGGRAAPAAPRVLRRGVEAGAGEVEAGRAAVGMDPLGLETRENAQGLRIALEAADPGGDLVERALPVVPEGRMPQVVREAGDLDDVRLAAERTAELPTDLGHLEAVRQPVADEV